MAQLLGLTAFTDSWMSDALLRVRANFDVSQRAGVLLVETRTGAAAAGELVRAIEAFEPAGIVVTVPPDGGAALDLGPSDVPRVVARRLPVGATVVPRGFDAEGTVDAGGSSEAWSLVGWAEAGGIHRCQLAGAAVDGRALPGLEVAALERSGRAVRRSGGACFGIDFRGGPGSLPRVGEDRVLEGGLVRDLVADRWVLVGPAQTDALHGLVAPTTRGAERMSLLEYQGHALDTLLRDAVLGVMPAWTAIVWLIAVAILVVWAEPRVRTRWLLPFTMLLGAVVTVLSVAVLLVAGLRPPWAATAVLLLVLHLLTIRNRLRVSGRAVRALAEGLLGRVAPRLLPDGFYLSENPWPALAEGVMAALGSNRMLLLEVGPDGSLREIHGAGSSIEEIDRDCLSASREPFRTALQRGSSTRLERPLIGARRGEVQGVAPLAFAGEGVGVVVWAAPDARADDPMFNGLVEDFAGQIAEVIYHRRRMGDAMMRDASGLAVRQGVGEAFATLEWLAVMLERRLSRFETLLRALGSSVVVFDLLGRVREVTDPMVERLAGDRISPYQLRAPELVAKLARIPVEDAQRAINGSLVTRQPVTLPAFLGGGSEPSTFVILNAIEVAAPPSDDEIRPVRGRSRDVLGISLELLETSSMQVLSEVKSQLTERLGDQLARDLDEMNAALQLLQSDEGGAAIREQVLGIVTAKMRDLDNLVDECRQYLAIDLQEIGRSRYPVDLRAPVERITSERRRAAERRQVDLEVALPEHVGQVLASPVALEEGVGSLLDFLLEDAEASAPIRVQVFEKPESTRVLFSNRGSGYMQEELAGIVLNGRESDRPVDRAVAVFAEHAALWGGSLKAESHIGVGTRFELNLARSKHL